MWAIKTVADTAASVFVPGYAAAKAAGGVVSWVAGQASGSQSASDFGSNAVKDEAKSEAWDAAATVASGSSKFGGKYSAGGRYIKFRGRLNKSPKPCRQRRKLSFRLPNLPQLNVKKFFKKLLENYLKIWKSKHWWKNKFLGLLLACFTVPLAIFIVWPWLEHIVVEKWEFEVSGHLLGMASYFIVFLGTLLIYLLYKSFKK